MAGRPAARITDNVLHLVPGVLVPGPPSPNVIIGGLPAWKGLPLGSAGGLLAAKAASDVRIKTAQAATLAAAGTPGLPAAKAAEETLKATEAAAMSATMASASGGASIHMCVHAAPVPVPPPHGPGLVIDGSPTVLINGLPACRLGDTILEAFGPPDKIIKGEVTVLIGNGAGGGGGGGGGAAGPAGSERKSPAGADAKREEDAKRQALLDGIKDGTSNIKVEGDEDFKKKTYEALDRLSQTPTGLALLQELEKSGKPVTIKQTPPGKGNTENADKWNDGLYDRDNGKPGPGTGSTVLFNPDRDKLNGEDWHERDPAIGLGHELIHSYHDANGTTDGRPDVEYTDADGNKQSAPGYELQTVGLGEYKDEPFTENALREDFDTLGVSSKGSEAQRPRY